MFDSAQYPGPTRDVKVEECYSKYIYAHMQVLLNDIYVYTTCSVLPGIPALYNYKTDQNPGFSNKNRDIGT